MMRSASAPFKNLKHGTNIKLENNLICLSRTKTYLRYHVSLREIEIRTFLTF